MRVKRAKIHAAEHEEVQAELARHEDKLVDMAARLVRLEAAVGIYKPLITLHDDDKGRS